MQLATEETAAILAIVGPAVESAAFTESVAAYRKYRAMAAEIAAKPRHRGQADVVARCKSAASTALLDAFSAINVPLMRAFPHHGAQWARCEAEKALDAYIAS